MIGVRRLRSLRALTSLRMTIHKESHFKIVILSEVRARSDRTESKDLRFACSGMGLRP